MDYLTKTLAVRVNEVLRKYISLQNEIFKFSFKKAFGLYRRDPEKTRIKLIPFQSELDSVREAIHEAKPSSDTAEGRFLITLRAYCRTMSESMDIFDEICQKLVKHRKDKKYHKDQFPEDIREFQLKEADYLEIGQKLNEQMKEISGTKDNLAQSEKK